MSACVETKKVGSSNLDVAAAANGLVLAAGRHALVHDKGNGHHTDGGTHGDASNDGVGQAARRAAAARGEGERGRGPIRVANKSAGNNNDGVHGVGVERGVGKLHIHNRGHSHVGDGGSGDRATVDDGVGGIDGQKVVDGLAAPQVGRGGKGEVKVQGGDDRGAVHIQSGGDHGKILDGRGQVAQAEVELRRGLVAVQARAGKGGEHSEVGHGVALGCRGEAELVVGIGALGILAISQHTVGEVRTSSAGSGPGQAQSGGVGLGRHNAGNGDRLEGEVGIVGGGVARAQAQHNLRVGHLVGHVKGHGTHGVDHGHNLRAGLGIAGSKVALGRVKVLDGVHKEEARLVAHGASVSAVHIDRSITGVVAHAVDVAALAKVTLQSTRVAAQKTGQIEALRLHGGGALGGDDGDGEGVDGIDVKGRRGVVEDAVGDRGDALVVGGDLVLGEKDSAEEAVVRGDSELKVGKLAVAQRGGSGPAWVDGEVGVGGLAVGDGETGDGRGQEAQLEVQGVGGGGAGEVESLERGLHSEVGLAVAHRVGGESGTSNGTHNLAVLDQHVGEIVVRVSGAGPVDGERTGLGQGDNAANSVRLKVNHLGGILAQRGGVDHGGGARQQKSLGVKKLVGSQSVVEDG
eukprot:m.222222 g.222222  ORF g.222222 m.222222 type:complete len:632 (+) comp15981_c0_seq1:202-2097(+)